MMGAMRIGILLSGRYPTEKAYGITTNATIKSLVKMGHQVYVFGLTSSYTQKPPVNSGLSIMNYKESAFLEFFKSRALSGKGLINKVSWWIFWKLLRNINVRELDELNLELLWIRDSAMLKFALDSKKIILEIHQDFKAKKLSRLISAKRVGSIVLAPISKQLVAKLKDSKLDIHAVYSPMSIDSEILARREDVLMYLERIRELKQKKEMIFSVGYVGKFFPNGYSKGVEDLLKLASYGLLWKKNYRVSITGGTELEVQGLLAKLNQYELHSNDLEISGHIQHSEALERLRELDVIVLPMPVSKSYVGFPLKALESAAVGRIVVAARCQIFSDIFSEEYEPYWYEPGSASSLDQAISLALVDSHLEQNVLKGVDFASRFTWDLRTKRILGGLTNRKSFLESH
jgi:glycosyltransferase involved in cell wall biosynthesis